MEIIGNIESFFRFIYSWITTTDEVLGRIIYVVHILVATTIAVLVVVSHTIYPVFWFQFMIFCIVLVVWLQHIFLQTQAKTRYLGHYSCMLPSTLWRMPNEVHRPHQKKTSYQSFERTQEIL